MDNIITVCDREADIYGFLSGLIERDCRFVVRATHDRKLVESTATLMEALSRSPVIGHHTVQIGQRGRQRAYGGQQPRAPRQAREARTELRAIEVSLSVPSTAQSKTAQPLRVNVVLVSEVDASQSVEGICWLIFDERADLHRRTDSSSRLLLQRTLANRRVSQSLENGMQHRTTSSAEL